MQGGLVDWAVVSAPSRRLHQCPLPVWHLHPRAPPPPPHHHSHDPLTWPSLVLMHTHTRTSVHTPLSFGSPHCFQTDLEWSRAVIPAGNQIKRHFYYSSKIKAAQSDPISEECLCGGRRFTSRTNLKAVSEALRHHEAHSAEVSLFRMAWKVGGILRWHQPGISFDLIKLELAWIFVCKMHVHHTLRIYLNFKDCSWIKFLFYLIFWEHIWGVRLLFLN